MKRSIKERWVTDLMSPPKRETSVALVILGLLVAALSAVQPAHGGLCTNPIFTTSDPNGGLGFDLNSDGVEDYYVHNNLWNAATYPGTQGTTEICSYNSWKHTAVANNNSGDGAVKTYPNTHRDYNSSPAVSGFPVLTSTFAGTAWGSGIYDVAYDIWLNNFAIEIMIWTENHDQRPGGNIVASGLSISGYTWDLWQSGSGYLAFAAPLDTGTGRPNNRVIASGNFDIKAFLNYLISTGRVPSNATMRQLDWGIEVVSTGGVAKVFNLTDFSITDSGSPPPPPTAPSGLTATAVSSSQINLSWTDNSNNENNFLIERATSAGGPFSQIASVGSNVTTYNNTGLAASTTYYYRVRASNTGGNSAYSNTANATTQGSLPAPWQTSDIGAVGAAGSASYSSGTFTVVGSGVDIQGTADEFRYVYQSVSGDCDIKARVTGVGNTNPWAKAGVMIRETLTAGSKHAHMIVSRSSGVEFLWRSSTGGTSSQSLAAGATPLWVRVVRSGNTFTGYKSTDGVTWTTVGTATVTMTTSVYIGLAVTAHNDGALCTSTFDNVTVLVGLPSPWQTSDIGAVGATGRASYSGGTFTVVGSGADIQGTADEFRYVYQTASGDCETKARVATVQNTNPWAKAGVMIRETLAANSKQALISLTPGNGVEFLWRATTGGTCSQAIDTAASAPYWIRVVRSGNTFTAYKSTNGTSWTQVGTSQTITMSTSVYIGLSVTSHADGTLCTSTFDNVTAVP
jgi:regulation of enolase protein 1 (concanavalin A-like superfamily)